MTDLPILARAPCTASGIVANGSGGSRVEALVAGLGHHHAKVRGGSAWSIRQGVPVDSGVLPLRERRLVRPVALGDPLSEIDGTEAEPRHEHQRIGPRAWRRSSNAWFVRRSASGSRRRLRDGGRLRVRGRRDDRDDPERWRRQHRGRVLPLRIAVLGRVRHGSRRLGTTKRTTSAIAGSKRDGRLGWVASGLVVTTGAPRQGSTGSRSRCESRSVAAPSLCLGVALSMALVSLLAWILGVVLLARACRCRSPGRRLLAAVGGVAAFGSLAFPQVDDLLLFVRRRPCLERSRGGPGEESPLSTASIHRSGTCERDPRSAGALPRASRQGSWFSLRVGAEAS
jgi:hypothetical protein